MTMHRGSDRYLVGTLLAKPLLLYSMGASINTLLQLFLVYIGLLAGPMSTESVSVAVAEAVIIYLPILPPIGLVDILNVFLNGMFAILLAAWWTVKWSRGMSR